MSNEANYITSDEVSVIASVLKGLSEVVKGSQVAFGDFEVFDSNGEVIGRIGFRDGDYRFLPNGAAE